MESFQDKLMTRREASQFLTNVLGYPTAERTLAKLATTGINAPPYFKCGHRCLYKESDLKKWMESKMVRRLSTSVEATND